MNEIDKYISMIGSIKIYVSRLSMMRMQIKKITKVEIYVAFLNFLFNPKNMNIIKLRGNTIKKTQTEGLS